MYKIFYANMAKGTGSAEIGIRPVVSIKDEGDYVQVLKITSRNRNDRFHAKMNHYLIYGYCDVQHTYRISKKYLTTWVRDCTTSEVDEINKARRKF